MDRGEHIFHDKALVKQDSVLVVVAFPGHESDEDVLAEGYLAVLGARAVCNDVALVNALAERNDWSLVYAGALVGACKLYKLIVLYITGIVFDGDVLRIGADDLAVAFREDDNAGVNGALMLDAGCDDRRLSSHKRNCLALHVRAHQCAVCVVVFEEWDHRSSDGYHHTGAYINVIDSLAVDLDNLVAVAAGYALIDKAAVFVARFGCRSNDVVILHVGGQVINLICDAAGTLLDLLERCNEEAVLVCSCVGCKVRDKSDVRAFGSLNRAQAAIVAVVNVTDVEGGSLTAQTAGAECRHTALVSKLGQGVCLIHELRQWAGTEEFFDRCGHGADIYKALRSYDIKILQGHTLADNTLHTGEADAELILQQLADAADAAVAEVVDIVLLADAVSKAVEIVDGCKHIVNNDVLRDKYIYIFKDSFLESVAGVLLHEALEDDAANLFLDTELLGVDIDHTLQRNHAVGEDLDGLAVNIKPDLNNTGSVDLLGHVA